MNIIGVTGPTGAGKSLLCHYLCETGIPCIDADGVYHSMLLPPSECLDALRIAFGDEIFTPDGSLDRTKLGAIVFSSKEKLQLLNDTVLPRVLNTINRIISDYKDQGLTTVALDAPTLIESGFHKECTYVISVLASADTRLKRIIERDELSSEKAELRIKAQRDDEFYIDHSNFILRNDGNPEKFKSDIISLISKLELNRPKGALL